LDSQVNLQQEIVSYLPPPLNCVTAQPCEIQKIDKTPYRRFAFKH